MSIFSDAFGIGVAGDAADAQTSAIGRARYQIQQGNNTAREDLRPFLEFGRAEMGELSRLNDRALALTGNRGQNDFFLKNAIFRNASDTLNRATMNNAAARGKLGSGSTLSALFKNNALLGSQLIGQQDALNNSQFNRLFSTIGVGERAANNRANIATGTAAAKAGLNTQQGNAAASGIIGNANALGGLVNTGISLATLGATGGMSGLTGLGGTGGARGSLYGTTGGANLLPSAGYSVPALPF